MQHGSCKLLHNARLLLGCRHSGYVLSTFLAFSGTGCDEVGLMVLLMYPTSFMVGWKGWRALSASEYMASTSLSVDEPEMLPGGDDGGSTPARQSAERLYLGAPQAFTWLKGTPSASGRRDMAWGRAIFGDAEVDPAGV